MKKSTRAYGMMATLLAVGLAIGGIGGVALSDSDEVPRPFAPRADAIGPCADCDDRVLGFGADPGPQSVADHITRGRWSICPAGFRGAGRFGAGGRCASNTTFRVWTETTSGLFRTPGLAPVATCEVGEQKEFEVVAERGAHRGPVRPGNPRLYRNTYPSSCSQIRNEQPELARQRFEVQQLSQVLRVLAETRDTASGEVVVAAHEIGQLRFPIAGAIGVEAALAR
ncbi:hypothetical protein ACXYTP_09275 [Tsukamurella ocularis]|uniref:hypothetical protein n=1 Tax=Tsukamurella ocularis TaxID=1970234 RepID=UPI0039EEC408